jgi:hypothetical protein
MPEYQPNLYPARSKSQQTKLKSRRIRGPVGDFSVKNLSILVPAVMAGVLVAATVLAAPLSEAAKPAPAGAPDRAAAYHLAMGN